MSRRSWSSTLDREKLSLYKRIFTSAVSIVLDEGSDSDEDINNVNVPDDDSVDDNRAMNVDDDDNNEDDMDISEDDSSEDDSSEDDSSEDDSSEDDSSEDDLSEDDSSDDHASSNDNSLDSLIQDDDTLDIITDDDNSLESLIDDDNSLDSMSEDDSVDDNSFYDISLDDDSFTDEFLISITKEIVKQHIVVHRQIEDDNIPFAGSGGHRKMIIDFNESECISWFRLRKDDLSTIEMHLWPRMSPYLGRDKMKIVLSNRYTAPFETCLLAYLYKMTRPQRLITDMEKIFCLRKAHLSSIVRGFGDALYEVSKLYLSHPSIFHDRMPLYADAINNKTEGLVHNVWGFIDATLRKTCRPLRFQRLVYSGYKRCHGLKLQTIVTPDGYSACVHGPYLGRQHDASILNASGMNELLEELMPMDGSNSPVYSIYGDMAYRQTMWIRQGFLNPERGSLEAQVNQILSRSRVSVEWMYGLVASKFAHIDCKSSMQIFKQKIAQQYINCIFMTNWSTCFHGNKTSRYFGVPVLSLKNI